MILHKQGYSKKLVTALLLVVLTLLCGCDLGCEDHDYDYNYDYCTHKYGNAYYYDSNCHDLYHDGCMDWEECIMGDQRILAENILDKDDFLSATEQEGEYIGQPEPDSGNAGSLSLESSGDIADFTYSGEATGDGAGGGTTVIDSLLDIYGDEYFIGGEVVITSGGASGETKAITDFAQATGTITTDAFSEQIVTGVTFTLTVHFETRNYEVELVGGGDLGDATFKWSHNGGTTFLGRDDPDQANWLGGHQLVGGSSQVSPTIVTQAANGNLVAIYQVLTGSITYAAISEDRGVTWGSPIGIDFVFASVFSSFILLKSGRLYCTTLGNYILYSDDNGLTWAVTRLTISDYLNAQFSNAVELRNGNVIGVWYDVAGVAGDLGVRISTDGGFNFSDVVEPDNGYWGAVVETSEGDVLLMYANDDESAGDVEIKAIKSTDGGVTWGSVIDVIDYDTVDFNNPSAAVDINGDIYCLATEGLSDIRLVYAKSTDGGTTWDAAGFTPTVLKSVGGSDIYFPNLVLIGGHELYCAYGIGGLGTTTSYSVRRGMWEAFSANACPTATNGVKQSLICDAHVKWLGNAGIAADSWTFVPEYQYAMSNIVSLSPSKPWRSKIDNAATMEIIIDMGANNAVYADSIAFFGCNWRNGAFQMNATNSWGSPSVDRQISFDLDATGVVDAVTANIIDDAALTANYSDHELTGLYLRMLDGTDAGVTWRIKDNIVDQIYLDSTAANSIAATDTFTIFQDHLALTFTPTAPYRFLRITMNKEHTSDDYMQIGTVIIGRGTVLSRGWSFNYQKDHSYNVLNQRTPTGGITPLKFAERKRIFSLSWRAGKLVRTEVLSLIDTMAGRGIVLLPDDDILTDCYLTVMDSNSISGRHVFDDRFNIGPILFEEVL